ncbi:hypothetical protein [Asticcacaulis sp.]|uniref:hypothetical protein n=1 Tax=Asticcacaulis sp. TaxID=1872648 RepID=UPI002614067C|nr:hypothetical protein [Asticcacaulis sp.]
MRYGEITSQVAGSNLSDRSEQHEGGAHSKEIISKIIVIRQSDHVAACKYLRDECGIDPIDINSMTPQVIQAVFENHDEQILFMLACECDRLSGGPGIIEKQVHILNFRQVRQSFQEAIDQIGLTGEVEVQHVVRMEARTFTETQMDEFERRFALK